MYDNTAGKTWLTMTNAERQASADQPAEAGLERRRKPWPAPPSRWRHVRRCTSRRRCPACTGFYDYNTASFGPLSSNPGALRHRWPSCPPIRSTAPAAMPSPRPVADAVRGKVAMIDRGTCGFAVKAKNAQNAGAIGVIIVNNVAGAAPGLGGSDPTDRHPDGERLAGRGRDR